MLQQVQPLFPLWYWSWKEGKDSLWLFSGMPGNCQCAFLDQYPNMRTERSVYAGHLWAAGCAGSLCDFVCPKSVSREPQARRVWIHPGPNSPDTHITTHRHIFLLETRNTAPPDISFLFQGSRLHWYLIPFRDAHRSMLWLPADDRAAAQIFSVMLPDTACAAGIMGLGTHVTLTKGLWKHKALALLSWTFMVPNEYFMCNTKTARILWATSNSPL